MTYAKGDITISVFLNPVFGKRPELMIGESNKLLKVASFGSEEKAKLFMQWIEYFMFGTEPQPSWEMMSNQKEEETS